jgi:hypothetical protein
MSKINHTKSPMNSKAFAASIVALIFSATLAPAHAETRTFGCSFVSRYSAGEVSMALSYARQAVGAGEAGNLYNNYVSLKNECRSNPTAKRVVNLSPAVVAVIAGN